MTDRYLGQKITRRDFLTWSGTLGAGAAAWACGEGKRGNPSIPSESSPLINKATIPPTIEVSGEIELRNSEKAVLHLGDWDLAVVDWQEIPQSKYRGSDPKVAEKFKIVIMQFIVRNVSDNMLDDDQFGGSLPSFLGGLVDNNGEVIGIPLFKDYLRAGGVINKPYLESDDGTISVIPVSYEKKFNIPPGFGFPMGLMGVLSKEVDDYGFVIIPDKDGLPNPNGIVSRGSDQYADLSTVVKKGEIAKDYPLIPSNAEIKQAYETLIIEGTSSDVIRGNVAYQIMGPDDEPVGSHLEQIVRMRLINNSNFTYRITDNTGGMLVYLKDGRVVPGQKFSEVEVIPGAVGNFEVTVAATSGTEWSGHVGDTKLYELVDFKDSVTVFTTNDGQFAAWHTPVGLDPDALLGQGGE